jgi:hypothetical protein
MKIKRTPDAAAVKKSPNRLLWRSEKRRGKQKTAKVLAAAF